MPPTLAEILILDDLYSRVPANVINGYFNDSGLNNISETDQIVQDVLMAAEGELYSRMLRAYPGDTTGALKSLVLNDPALKMHLAWVACELACERRPEFTDAEGFGAYKAQYMRAIAYFENLSKGLIRSRGEQVAGKGRNTGGDYQPNEQGEGEFTFAPSRNNPGGHGGFIIPLLFTFEIVNQLMVRLA